MHSFPAASVAAAAARAATLRPEAAVGGTGRSAGTQSEPSCVTSLAARSSSPPPPPPSRSLPPCEARLPPPAAGGCDVPPPPPPKPLTDGAGAPPAPGPTPPLAAAPPSSLSRSAHTIEKKILKTCFAEKTTEKNLTNGMNTHQLIDYLLQLEC